MKIKAGFFLADSLLALFIFLLGVQATHRLVQATAQARLNHQLRLKARSLLEDAPAWKPQVAEMSWQRAFDFQLVPVEAQGFFQLSGSEQQKEQSRIFEFRVRYSDAFGTAQQINRSLEVWEVRDAGI